MRIEALLVAMQMGIASLVLLALSVATPRLSVGADRLAQAAPRDQPKASQPAEPKAPTAEDANTKEKNATRRKNFRPSERITADTAVAFPVDI